MNIIDLLIIIVIAYGAYHWYKIGLVRNFFSVGGLIIGVIFGLLIAPLIISFFNEPLLRFLVVILTVGALSLGLGSFGEMLGAHINFKIKSEKLQKLNSILGALASVFVGLLLIWIAAAITVTSPFKNLNNLIQNSTIIHILDKNLPPTPPLVDKINTLVEPIDFPQVFSGIPEKLSPPVAPAGSETVRKAVELAGQSTVKIEASGCGNLLSAGSGFVTSNKLIMTNAHVVAGSSNIQIVSTSGKYRAELVYFNPSVDIAILKSSKVNQPQLKISGKFAQRGEEAVALGFPGGGDFQAEPIGIMRSLQAKGLDIYNNSSVSRDVYEFIGNVVRGNSGGPIVNSDGTVIGMVFAAAQNQPGFGYALTGSELIRAVNESSYQAVGSGACISE